MYKLYNPDLDKMSSMELIKHFIQHGINEKHRIYNLKTYTNNYNFDVNIYKICNIDLQHLSDNKLLNHFIKSGINESRVFNINLLIKKYKLDSKYIEEYKKFIINKNYDEIKLYFKKIISDKIF